MSSCNLNPRAVSHYYPLPEYVSDSSNGFVQAAKGQNFKGTTGNVPFTGRNTAYVFLNNPVCSGVKIAINKIFVANLSAGAVVYTSSINPSFVIDKTAESGNAANSNSLFICDKPEGQILYESTNGIVLKPATYESVIPAASTDVGLPNGSIILAPGSCLAIAINPLLVINAGNVAVSFSWWEF